MSRRICAVVALVVLAVLGASACSNNATGPAPSSIRADATCTNWASNGTCLH